MSKNIPSPMDNVNDLAKCIDERHDSPPRSPIIHARLDSTDSFVKSNVKSSLPGWSPNRNADGGTKRRPSGSQVIDNFTLGPIASGDTASVDNDAQNVQGVKMESGESRSLKKKTDVGKDANKGKKGGDPGRQYPKKPKLSKKERRALQEAQRARKAALNKGANKQQGNAKHNGSESSSNKNGGSNKVVIQNKKGAAKNKSHGGHAFFSHLPQYQSTSTKSEKLLFTKNEQYIPQ